MFCFMCDKCFSVMAKQEALAKMLGSLHRAIREVLAGMGADVAVAYVISTRKGLGMVYPTVKASVQKVFRIVFAAPERKGNRILLVLGDSQR